MNSVEDKVYFKAEDRGIAISWDPPPLKFTHAWFKLL